jgi:serine phosphatase RsbU (regulator of sigma subunit)
MLPSEFGTGDWLALVSAAAERFSEGEQVWVARCEAELHLSIEHDLERAREIQRHLIPSHPDVPGLDVAIGFEPCHWVGGDYVDAVPLADGRAFLTVADVCGKGLQAALVASGVHSRVHAGLDAGLGLEEVMEGVNHYLHEFLPEDSFVTRCSMLIDPVSGEMQVMNAGHPAPIMLDASGNVRRLASGLNLPLRVAGSLSAGHDRLGPDEVLLMFTDGLLESGEDRSMDAGFQCLTDGLRAARTAGPLSTVAERLSGFLRSAGTGAHDLDDRTFLLARRAK